MRIHRRRRRGQQAKKLNVPEYEANEKISADTLFLITDDGEQVGKISKAEAMKLAKERKLDLVVVAPNADPPVAKLLDYGQFKYQKEKEARKQKAQSKQTETKAIRLSTRIGRHDIDVRIKRVLEFFKRGDKIKLEIILRGREKAYTDRGREVMEEFIQILRDEHELDINVEQEFKRQGSRLTMVIGLK